MAKRHVRPSPARAGRQVWEGSNPPPSTRHPDPALTDILDFLREGRATHPDEQEAQNEYDLMRGAIQTGQNINSARTMAQSHLNAHRKALLPQNINNPLHNPYVGLPEENLRAIDGFRLVISRLRAPPAPKNTTKNKRR